MIKKIDKSPILRTRLRRVLDRKKVSASYVSRFAGFNETIIKNILQGRSKSPRAETIERLERTLGLPLGFLLASKEDTLALAANSRKAEALRLEARERGENFDHNADLLDETFWGPIHPDELRPYVKDVGELRRIQATLETSELFDPDELPIPLPQPSPQTPIVGIIGAGGHVFPIDDHAKGEGLDYVPAPPGSKSDTCAAIVRGNSFYPFLRDGSLIFYSKIEFNVADWLHKMVICNLKDGRRMVKVLTPGTKAGRFTLTSPSAPPIENVAVASINPIDMMTPKN